jgi:hypothetical protein
LFSGRDKRNNVIDVECITPNPFIKWLKSVKWLRIIATLILRIGRCWNATDPGAYMMAVLGVAVGIMGTFFPYMIETHSPSLFVSVLHTTWTSLWLTIVLEAFLYGCWELVQGCKWLKEWAKKHTESGYEDDD